MRVKFMKWLNNLTFYKVLFYLLILVLIFSILPLTYGDPDGYWHIKFGEYVYNNGFIPKTDIFSWYGIENRLQIFPQEWLSQILMYLVYKFIGLNNISYFTAMMGVIITIILYTTNKSLIEEKKFVSISIFLFIMLTFSKFIVLRPQIFSYILLIISIYIIRKYKEHDTKLIWLIPLIALLWINLHGGTYILLFVLLGSLLFSSLFSFNFKHLFSQRIGKTKWLKLIIVALISVVMSLINPQFFNMLKYPFVNITNSYIITVLEWLPPTLNDFIGVSFYIFLLIMLIALLTTNKKVDFFDFIIFVLFSCLAIKGMRFIPLFYITCFPIFVKYVSIARFNNYMVSLIKRNIVIFLIFVSAIAFTQLYNSIQLYKNQPFVKDVYPDEKVIELIKKESPERLYNCYNWGGYLIYNNIKVFVDGRFDLYVDSIYKDSLSLINPEIEGEEILNKYDFDYILYPTNSKLTKYLKNNNIYMEIYSDSVCTLFKKIY